MIVVSDTSPLNYLVLVAAIDVLPHLFSEVYAPPTVIVELTRLKTAELVREWATAPPSWLQIEAPLARLPSTARLGNGEADALSLAKELGIRDLLIDERRGRHVAQREALNPPPMLAVLERAAQENLLELRSVLDRLRQTNIRVSQAHLQAALERDAARKRQ